MNLTDNIITRPSLVVSSVRMSINHNGHELDDVAGGKSIDSHVVEVSQKEYEDQDQLARLGKKSVLRVRIVQLRGFVLAFIEAN